MKAHIEGAMTIWQAIATIRANVSRRGVGRAARNAVGVGAEDFENIEGSHSVAVHERMRAITRFGNSYSEMQNSGPSPLVSPRKQPRQRRSAATVAAVLEAAARILEENGFEGFTTNAIAERAGVGVGSFYQYFPNKEAATAALIAREAEGLIGELRRAGAATTWSEGMRKGIEAAVSHQLRRPRLARLLDMAERVLHLDGGQPAVGELARAMIEDLFSRRDAPKVDDIPTVSADVTAIARGLIDAAGERGEVDRASLVARVDRAVFGYLAMTQTDCRPSRASRLLHDPE